MKKLTLPGDEERRQRRRTGVLILVLLVVVAGGAAAWFLRDYWRPPEALYREAQTARPARAAAIYTRLGERLPEIEEYARLWGAAATMPNVDAVDSLQAVASYRPQSPAAHETHLALARHYAALEAPQAEEHYRAALAVEDSVAGRLELARHLEEMGDLEGAYAGYRQVLGERPDAFEGMRRTGQDPLAVAADLNAAQYYSDAVDTLREVTDPAALPLRAEALAGLGRYEEARDAYRAWLADTPDDQDARLGLGRALEMLDSPAQALVAYRAVDTADGQLARADLLAQTDADAAVDLYLESPYPIAWWSATSLLEAQGRLTETLPLYTQVGTSDTFLADDAAYRLHVLAGRLDDETALDESEALLEGLGLNWLALRAEVTDLALGGAPAPAVTQAADEIWAKAQALASIGAEDLARRELVTAAKFRRAPEIDLAMAGALAERGDVVEAQAIAAPYTLADPRAPRAFWELSYPRPYSATVTLAAEEFGVDPLLVWAVMREESRYDPEAQSWVGARGLMQIMPPTQAWIAEELDEPLPPGAAFVPEANVRMGAWFLRFLLDYFDDDLELVIAAYNGGPGSVDAWLSDPRVEDRDDFLRWIEFGETREYLSRVSLSYEIYQALYGEEP